MEGIQPVSPEQIHFGKNAMLRGDAYQERIPFLTRIFVWSLVLEPLLFFVLFERTISGVTSNLARLLQMAVIGIVLLRTLLLSRIIDLSNVKIPHPGGLLYIHYSFYFLLSVLAGMIGFVSGAYDIRTGYALNDSESFFSQFLNSPIIRPLFEYVIALYYFIYFSVLPQYFLNSKKTITYFFTLFKVVFALCLLIGAIDLCFSAMGIYLVPRHIADWRYVGARFHGLAGEPRDAFVYLFFGLAMLHLRAHFLGKPLRKWWIAAVILAAILTQSASGLIGVLFFLGLYGGYIICQFSLRRLIRLCIFTILVCSLLYVVAINTERIMLYLASASNLWDILETGKDLPYLMSVQIENIYPLYDLTVKLRQLDFFPVVFGSGLGSASAVNHVYDPSIGGMTNPYSQFVRIIFESGLVGGVLFVMSFVFPMRHLTKHLTEKKQHEFMLLTFLLIGCFLGHRSAAGFIYLGIAIAAFRVMQQRKMQQ